MIKPTNVEIDVTMSSNQYFFRVQYRDGLRNTKLEGTRQQKLEEEFANLEKDDIWKFLERVQRPKPVFHD